jgi:hypothetical protein
MGLLKDVAPFINLLVYQQGRLNQGLSVGKAFGAEGGLIPGWVDLGTPEKVKSTAAQLVSVIESR